jgi:hypothetical protein
MHAPEASKIAWPIAAAAIVIVDSPALIVRTASARLG